jgi:hypothetical protein
MEYSCGVSYSKLKKMWVSYVSTTYRRYTLGYYKTQYDALMSLNTKHIEILQINGNVMEI